MQRDDRIYVAGHRGMVGAAIVRALEAEGFTNLVTRTHAELPLDEPDAVREFFAEQRIDHVFLAAAKVGGIVANDRYPADFIRQNLLIQTNVIDAAWRSGARKLLFLGSSCIYPRMAEQPIREDSLLTGALEETNAAYAIAKIAGVATCDAYRKQHGFDAITVMPSNIYGIGDNFDPEHSHVVAGMMRRLHEARVAGLDEVAMWGTGKPLRELTYCDDLASACLFLMQHYSEPGIINAGSGIEYRLSELAAEIAAIVGYSGQVVWDHSRPDGTPRKLMAQDRIHALGWRAKVPLAEGLRRMYDWWRRE
ncbi:GDP-L-fucose synthase [Sphingomonas sp. MMSM24]|uniref:GDP-L-fucose synthase n=2 Tax=Sphingomonas lycopersici TaxID=2951807 RepID=A0AA42CSH4_9SPHN|nr:GDP-L-fucose synthase [Sphingomonas lycopersici]MCW6537287.1 GDP-L-fucose synthase [Sphingomonas lycopersici]